MSVADPCLELSGGGFALLALLAFLSSPKIRREGTGPRASPLGPLLHAAFFIFKCRLVLCFGKPQPLIQLLGMTELCSNLLLFYPPLKPLLLYPKLAV